MLVAMGSKPGYLPVLRSGRLTARNPPGYGRREDVRVVPHALRVRPLRRQFLDVGARALDVVRVEQVAQLDQVLRHARVGVQWGKRGVWNGGHITLSPAQLRLESILPWRR